MGRTGGYSYGWRHAVGTLISVVMLGLTAKDGRYGCDAVEIRRLSVPRSLQNGSVDSVVLDCEYVYNENDFRLVVKWFFEDNTEPVYQWIPGLNSRHVSGILKNRLDLNFSVSTVDTYSKFRALRILRPTTEIGGKYTCVVSSLAAQDAKEQVMTVFVPAEEFELSYRETIPNSVNVSCETLGVYPLPVLKLYVRPSSGSAPKLLNDSRVRTIKRPSGSFDVLLHRTFINSELNEKGATVFECLLELPGTKYSQSKRIAYLPGIQSPRLEAPYGLSSFSPWSNTRNEHFFINYIIGLIILHGICARSFLKVT